MDSAEIPVGITPECANQLFREYKELKMEMQVVFADFVDEADSENVAGQYAADVVLGRHKITEIQLIKLLKK